MSLLEKLQLLAVTIDSGDAPSIPRVGATEATAGGVLNVVYAIAAAVAVIVIVYSGILYTISSGDAGKIGKAKNNILYAIAGLVIVLSAFAITNFVFENL